MITKWNLKVSHIFPMYLPSKFLKVCVHLYNLVCYSGYSKHLTCIFCFLFVIFPAYNWNYTENCFNCMNWELLIFRLNSAKCSSGFHMHVTPHKLTGVQSQHLGNTLFGLPHFLSFDTGFHYVALADLELAM